MAEMIEENEEDTQNIQPGKKLQMSSSVQIKILEMVRFSRPCVNFTTWTTVETLDIGGDRKIVSSLIVFFLNKLQCKKNLVNILESTGSNKSIVQEILIAGMLNLLHFYLMLVLFAIYQLLLLEFPPCLFLYYFFIYHPLNITSEVEESICLWLCFRSYVCFFLIPTYGMFGIQDISY